jgi:hypothetical protein
MCVLRGRVLDVDVVEQLRGLVCGKVEDLGYRRRAEHQDVHSGRGRMRQVRIEIRREEVHPGLADAPMALL